MTTLTTARKWIADCSHSLPSDKVRGVSPVQMPVGAVFGVGWAFAVSQVDGHTLTRLGDQFGRDDF